MMEFEHRLTVVEDRSKGNSRRLDDMEKRQDDLAELVSTVKVLAVREEVVENDVKEIKTTVKTLADKPARRWDSLINALIVAAVSALVGFVFGSIF